MKRISKEFWVGLFVLSVIVVVLAMAWLVGLVRPFARDYRYQVLYGFAGGVEVGSPVRVSGVKVGRVERIEFLPEVAGQGEDRVALRLTLTVARRAAPSVRQDSRFYVNMAGIIGERYIEITPGTSASPPLTPGSTVRGVDPPRIDQLLSQGYGVFGKIMDFLDENEPIIVSFLTEFKGVLSEANTILKGKDRKQIMALISNLNEITEDVKGLAKKWKDPRAEEFFLKLLDMVRRGHEIDKQTLKKFFQDEGIRARVF